MAGTHKVVSAIIKIIWIFSVYNPSLYISYQNNYTMNTRICTRKKLPLLLFSSLFALFFLSSCYSVRIVNRDGTPEPDPLNTTGNFYKGKKVHVLDTTISLKLIEGDFYLIERCPSGCFFSVEYRVTFGGVLLSAVTLGKKRRVKIKYVCMKEQ